MKRFCIINVEGLRDVLLMDFLPIGQETIKGCEVLPGNYRPVFFADRESAITELLRLADIHGPKFHLFETTHKAITRPAVINGARLDVSILEPVTE